jgi:cytochrome P450
VRDNVTLIRRLLRDPAPVLDDCVDRFGSTFCLGIGPVRLVVVGDPDDLATLFSQPNSSYRWGHLANALGFIVGPTSLLVSDGDDHRRRRAAVQPAFARRRLERWIPMMIEQTDAMISNRLQPSLASRAPVDVYPLGKDLVLAITIRAFFGNGLEDREAEIRTIFDELQSYMELPALRQLPHRIPRTRRARVRAARAAFDRLVDEEVARRRAAGPDGADTGDLLDVFVDAPNGSMTTQEIHDSVTTLIGAGYNTTAASVAWTVQRSLATPGIWERLRAEADDVLGPDGGAGSLAADGLRSLELAGAVVHEALRLHPAGVVAPRQAVVAVPTDRGVIPRRALVLWSAYVAGRDADVWDDPLTFRPERHLDPSRDAAARMDAAWVPFGRGPRRCLGFALAQVELTLIIARLAQRLDMELVAIETPRPYGMIVNRPDGGVLVRSPARRTASA